MRRTRRSERPGNSRAGAALARLATTAAASGSRLEDRWWEQRLVEAVRPMLTASGQNTLDAALDRLWNAQPRAYDLLADAIETAAGSGVVVRGDVAWDCLLILVPVLAWSPAYIPHGALRAADLDALRVQLGAHVLAPSARLALLPHLFTPDQMPASFHEEASLARELFSAVVDGKTPTVKGDALAQAIEFVSDSRYLIGAIAVPAGEPLFAWQGDAVTLEDATRAWQAQGGSVLASSLTGCQVEVLMPGAFYSTLRRIDRNAREFYLRSGVAFIEAVLGRIPSAISAALAPFYETDLVEYRVGFSIDGGETVVHGVTWPMLGDADEEDAPSRIRELLQACGVSDIVEHDHRFPLEFCDDCGAPLFPNAQGEVLHAEMPEDAEPPPRHLH